MCAEKKTKAHTEQSTHIFSIDKVLSKISHKKHLFHFQITKKKHLIYMYGCIMDRIYIVHTYVPTF